MNKASTYIGSVLLEVCHSSGKVYLIINKDIKIGLNETRLRKLRLIAETAEEFFKGIID